MEFFLIKIFYFDFNFKKKKILKNINTLELQPYIILIYIIIEYKFFKYNFF